MPMNPKFNPHAKTQLLIWVGRNSTVVFIKLLCDLEKQL